MLSFRLAIFPSYTYVIESRKHGTHLLKTPLARLLGSEYFEIMELDERGHHRTPPSPPVPVQGISLVLTTEIEGSRIDGCCRMPGGLAASKAQGDGHNVKDSVSHMARFWLH